MLTDMDMLELKRKNFERSPAFQFFAGTLIALFVAAFYVVGDWLFRIP